MTMTTQISEVSTFCQQPSGERPTLHVLLLHGVPLNLDWCWPESMETANLAQVFETLALEMDNDTREELASCVLQISRNPGGAISFHHDCQVLRCSHNGTTVAASQPLVLRDRDQVEVGLCRWSLSTATCEVDQTSGPISVTKAVSFSLPAPALAADSATTVLPASAPQVVTDECPPVQVQATNSTDPLDQWHRHYLHHLQFPHELGIGGVWAAGCSTPASTNEERDPLNKLIDQCAEGISIGEMLGQHEDIGAVLIALDALGEQDILSDTPPDSVLHLFAPQDWKAPDEQLALPLISRMEHHAVALDSAFSGSDMPLACPSSRSSGKPTETADKP